MSCFFDIGVMCMQRYSCYSLQRHLIRPICITELQRRRLRSHGINDPLEGHGRDVQQRSVATIGFSVAHHEK